MREIFFRGKAINREDGFNYRSNYKNGDWVYGLVTKNYNGKYDLAAEMTNEVGVSGIEVDYKTIGQYIGCTDIKGKMIFEGDIIKCEMLGCGVKYGTINFGKYAITPDNPTYNIGFYINWFNNPFTRQELGFWLKQRKIVIIGNIYDNPELLKGDKKNEDNSQPIGS